MLVKMFRIRKCQKYKDDIYLTFAELANELKDLPNYELGKIIEDLFDGKTNKINGDKCWYELGDYRVNVDENTEGFKRRLDASNGDRAKAAKAFGNNSSPSSIVTLKDFIKGDVFALRANNRIVLFDKNDRRINVFALENIDNYLSLEVLETKESGYQDYHYFVGFKTLHIKLNIDNEEILSGDSLKFGEAEEYGK